jgi:hypothetical protein
MQTTEAAMTRQEVSSVDVILPLVAFAVPFFVAGPQWLTGTLVNAILFLAAVRLRWTTRAVIVLPGIAAVLHGVVFGVFTPFLAYFLPFIWLGNGLLIHTANVVRERMHWSIAVVVGAILKSSLLFLSALVFVRLGIVPELFVRSMGLIQLFTAIAGGCIAFSILSFAKEGN